MNKKRSAGLQRLLEEYRLSLPDKQAQIEQAWDAAVSSGWSAETSNVLGTQVHQLAGSAGSYGFPQLSAAARLLDRLLADVRDGAANLDEGRARALLDELIEQFNLEGSR